MMKTLYLPFELIIEILLRLPAKSLYRLKRVCKSWFSLISNPNFANSHFQITSATRILSITAYKIPMFHSLDFEINRKFVLLNHNFSLDRPYFHCFQIKGSCRGFICLYGGVHLWIWNPSNGIHKRIPLSPFGSKLREYNLQLLYGFGYDQSRDDYLVILLSYDPRATLSSHLEFFSMRDNTWNETGATRFTYVNASGVPGKGSFFNGSIHWLAKRFDLSVDVIVAFDLMERKLFEIPLPDDFPHHRKRYGIWLFGEFLSLWVKDYANHTIEIWVMKEYKLHSSWTKTLVIPVDRIAYIDLVCSTKSGDIIGKVDNKLVKYNDKGQLEYLQYIDCYANELAMYTESLFSLPDEL